MGWGVLMGVKPGVGEANLVYSDLNTRADFSEKFELVRAQGCTGE